MSENVVLEHPPTMAKKKSDEGVLGHETEQPAEGGPGVRKTINMPVDLDRKLTRAARRRHVTYSIVVRDILQSNIDSYVGSPESGDRVHAVTVHFEDDMAEALAEAASLWRLPVEALIKLVLAESLPEFVQRGRTRSEKLRGIAHGGA